MTIPKPVHGDIDEAIGHYNDVVRHRYLLRAVDPGRHPRTGQRLERWLDTYEAPEGQDSTPTLQDPHCAWIARQVRQRTPLYVVGTLMEDGTIILPEARLMHERPARPVLLYNAAGGRNDLKAARRTFEGLIAAHRDSLVGSHAVVEDARATRLLEEGEPVSRPGEPTTWTAVEEPGYRLSGAALEEARYVTGASSDLQRAAAKRAYGRAMSRQRGRPREN